MFTYLQHLWSSYNSLGLCYFVSFPHNRFWAAESLVALVRAVTGWNFSLWELLKAGERATTMARLFNCREGFTPADDTVPDRFFEPLEDGPLAGAALDRGELAGAIRTYYEMMGWHAVTGVPTAGRLAELDIDFVAPRASGRGE